MNFGANTETRDRQGKVKIFIIKKKILILSLANKGLTPLMRYARQANGMEALLLLLKYGADVNAMADGRNDFRTVLHYAILSGKPATQ